MKKAVSSKMTQQDDNMVNANGLVEVTGELLTPLEKEIYDSLFNDHEGVEQFVMAYFNDGVEEVAESLREELSKSYDDVDWYYCIDRTLLHMFISLKVLEDRTSEPDVKRIFTRLRSVE